MPTFLYDAFELLKRDDVTLLIFAVIWTVFLDGIIRQVHEIVVEAG